MNCLMLCRSEEHHEAELLDDVEEDEERVRRFDGEDDFPVDDEQLYDEGKCHYCLSVTFRITVTIVTWCMLVYKIKSSSSVLQSQ